MKTTESKIKSWVLLSAYHSLVLLAIGAMPAAGSSASSAAEIRKPSCAETARAAAKEGTITYRLTTPDELQRLLGEPQHQQNRRDGDMVIKVLEFPGVRAVFGKVGDFSGSYTLVELRIEDQAVDIGRERQVVLRTVEDLNKLDAFWGLAGMSLVKLDLQDQAKAIGKWTFDSRTIWPGTDRLPPGFDPARLMEEGKNPGLGIRKLHAEGVDGKGIGLAIIDQPLLKEHEEYRDQIIQYNEVDLDGAGPQMHGPTVASIAVGKTCGVAPAAALYFFAVPTWKWSRTEPWAEQLERVVELNQTLVHTPKIRVVSISLGAFSQRPNLARWQQAVQKAEQNGILVLTCDPTFLRLATLKRLEDRSEPTATDYSRGMIGYPEATLCVPAANRTFASFRGPHVYTYDRTGGLSWTVPYLAGVAALAWQVNPAIKADEMVKLWVSTSIKTGAGQVINPLGVVEAAKNRAQHR
jgi:hypothetical protein